MVKPSLNSLCIIKICLAGSGDYGLFQISKLYWCSADGYAACGITCSALLDDDIEDDMICARRIYRQHQRISGDGFNAWTVYGYYCKNRNLDSYVEDCFNTVRKQAPTEATPFTRRTEAEFNNSVLFRNEVFSSSTERFVPKWKTSPKPFIKSEGAFPKFIIYKSGKSDYTFRRKGNGFQLFKVINDN